MIVVSHAVTPTNTALREPAVEECTANANEKPM